MKLHADAQSALNTVTAYDVGYVEINAERYHQSILVIPEGAIQPSPVSTFNQLDPEFFSTLAMLSPELVILGTGRQQHFPHPRLMQALTEKRIGVESMTTAAAARTYNILMAEGRKVLAVFLIDPPLTEPSSGGSAPAPTF